jgi:hypothetical protein
MKPITAYAVLQDTKTSSSAQQACDRIQHAQEQAVNAGHRPDRAVSYILAMEDQRDAIAKAMHALERAVWKAEEDAAKLDTMLRD